MLLFHDDFLGYVRTYRHLWVNGRYSSGKTAISYRIAYELCNRWGYKYMFSNGESVWNDPVDKMRLNDNGMLNAVILLDEGGLFLNTARDIEEFKAFMAKLNTVILLPSIDPPPNRFRRLELQSLWKMSNIGLPIWLYQWRLQSGFIENKGFFAWLNPSEIFGVYSRQDAPIDDAGISEKLNENIKAFVERQGRKYTGVGRRKLVSVEGMEESGGAFGSTEAFEEAAERIEQAAGSISVSVRRASKRRR